MIAIRGNMGEGLETRRCPSTRLNEPNGRAGPRQSLRRGFGRRRRVEDADRADHGDGERLVPVLRARRPELGLDEQARHRSSAQEFDGLPGRGGLRGRRTSSDLTFAGEVTPLLDSSEGERNRVSTLVPAATSTTTRLSSSAGWPLVATEFAPLAASFDGGPSSRAWAWSRAQSRQTAFVLMESRRRAVSALPSPSLAAFATFSTFRITPATRSARDGSAFGAAGPSFGCWPRPRPGAHHDQDGGDGRDRLAPRHEIETHRNRPFRREVARSVEGRRAGIPRHPGTGPAYSIPSRDDAPGRSARSGTLRRVASAWRMQGDSAGRLPRDRGRYDRGLGEPGDVPGSIQKGECVDDKTQPRAACGARRPRPAQLIARVGPRGGLGRPDRPGHRRDRRGRGRRGRGRRSSPATCP